MLGVLDAFQKPLSVLHVHAVIFHAGVEGALQTVAAQVLTGEDAEGLVACVAFGRPQRTHFGDGVDAALVLVVDTQELLLADAQTA
jgi:hypothetical protein